eukprot:gene14111-4199_t
MTKPEPSSLSPSRLRAVANVAFAALLTLVLLAGSVHRADAFPIDVEIREDNSNALQDGAAGRQHDQPPSVFSADNASVSKAKQGTVHAVPSRKPERTQPPPLFQPLSPSPPSTSREDEQPTVLTLDPPSAATTKDGAVHAATLNEPEHSRPSPPLQPPPASRDTVQEKDQPSTSSPDAGSASTTKHGTVHVVTSNEPEHSQPLPPLQPPPPPRDDTSVQEKEHPSILSPDAGSAATTTHGAVHAVTSNEPAHSQPLPPLQPPPPPRDDTSVQEKEHPSIPSPDAGSAATTKHGAVHAATSNEPAHSQPLLPLQPPPPPRGDTAVQEKEKEQPSIPSPDAGSVSTTKHGAVHAATSNEPAHSQPLLPLQPPPPPRDDTSVQEKDQPSIPSPDAGSSSTTKHDAVHVMTSNEPEQSQPSSSPPPPPLMKGQQAVPATGPSSHSLNNPTMPLQSAGPSESSHAPSTALSPPPPPPPPLLSSTRPTPYPPLVDQHSTGSSEPAPPPPPLPTTPSSVQRPDAELKDAALPSSTGPVNDGGIVQQGSTPASTVAAGSLSGSTNRGAAAVGQEATPQAQQPAKSGYSGSAGTVDTIAAAAAFASASSAGAAFAAGPPAPPSLTASTEHKGGGGTAPPPGTTQTANIPIIIKANSISDDARGTQALPGGPKRASTANADHTRRDMDDDDGLDMDDHAGFDINDPTTLGGIILGGILGSIVLVKTIMYMRQTCCNREHEMYMGTCGGRGQKGLLTILFLFGLDGWGLYSLLKANDQNYGDYFDDDDDAGSIEAATSDTTATAGVVFCVIALFLWAMM